MKKTFLKILQLKLKFFAKWIIRKYQPDIIGITGSVGKTSAKEAIFAVLSSRFNTAKNLKNYNNEIGLPLSIIRAESGRKNIFSWFKIFLKASKLIFSIDVNYPQFLVLEMGADKVGDISYLTSIAKPQIAVVTGLAPVHLEFFGTMEKLSEEKKQIIKHLKADEWLVYNKDYFQLEKFSQETNARVFTYGFSPEADLRAYDEKIIQKDGHWGISFRVSYKGNDVPFFLQDILGKPQIYAILAGMAVGLIYELNLIEISNYIKNYKPAKSRLHVLPGIKNTTLIDDSYNSSPEACQVALQVLKEFPLNEGKRWAVLGDMLELGSYTEEGHQLVGREIADLKIDYLITVGEKAKDIKKGALENGFPEDRVYSFGSTDEAGHFLQEQIKENDLILLKGSQGARIEKIVKEVMAEPNRATELVCRQDESWLK